jgi:hypothetical protein
MLPVKLTFATLQVCNVVELSRSGATDGAAYSGAELSAFEGIEARLADPAVSNFAAIGEFESADVIRSRKTTRSWAHFGECGQSALDDSPAVNDLR